MAKFFVVLLVLGVISLSACQRTQRPYGGAADGSPDKEKSELILNKQ